MITRLLAVAVVAGIAAGLFASLVQESKVTPLIYQAEAFEVGHGHGDTASAGDGHDHDHDAAAWAPDDGLERKAFTWMTNVLTGFGYGLLLVAGYAFSGRELDWRKGLLWGLGGFAAFALAPALVLPPELPGAAAADLGLRQALWIGVALATAVALALIAFGRGLLWRVLGGLLLIAPVALPAPHGEGAGSVPPELAAHFVAASLVMAALFWACLGSLSGALYRRWAA